MTNLCESQRLGTLHYARKKQFTLHKNEIRTLQIEILPAVFGSILKNGVYLVSLS